MIVWGGFGANGLNTGGRYYADIDLWVDTSITNAPSSRFSFHTAVWTGSEMVVWGGGSSNGELNTGGRYCVPSGLPTPTPAPTPCPGRIFSLQRKRQRPSGRCGRRSLMPRRAIQSISPRA